MFMADSNMNKLTFLAIAISGLIFSSFSTYAGDEKQIEEQVNKEKITKEKVSKEKKVETKKGQAKKLYRVVDEKGNISYSDEPSKGSKEMIIENIPSIKMTKPKVDYDIFDQEEIGREKRDPDAGYYDSIGFLNLTNDGVVRNNAGTVTLTAKLEPELSRGHSLKFYIDGKLIGSQQKALTITAENIEYGPHTASFVVVSKTGRKVQESDKVNFALLHTVRKKANNVNAAVNKVFNNEVFKSGLPEHPKVPTYESMKSGGDDSK